MIALHKILLCLAAGVQNKPGGNQAICPDPAFNQGVREWDGKQGLICMYDERWTIISLCASVWKPQWQWYWNVFFITTNTSRQVERPFTCMRNPVLLGLHNLKRMGPWNYLQKSCSPRQAVAEGDEVICMWDMPKAKQQRNTSPSLTSSCRAAPAQGSVLLLYILAPGELFETSLAFDRHPPLQLQSISVDTVAVIFIEDLGLHSSNWGMRKQHNGPNNTVLGVATKCISLLSRHLI